MKNKITISKELLYKAMEEKEIKTQTELAEKMGISKNQLSVILSEKFNPIKSNVMKLCETLDINFNEIMQIKDEKIEQLSFDHDELTLNIAQKIIKNKDTENDDLVDISKVIAKRPYNVVELFAGAGGLALGLEQAGFKEVGLVEFDKNPCNTLRKNRPNWNVIEDDVVKVAEEGIRQYIDKNIDIDLLSGGYPCQSFSYAGKKAGLEDVRGTMFYYYAEILSQLKPKVFLAENVKGLVNDDGGKTLQIMIDVFTNIGYKVQWKIHNALDFAVAQKRQRIVIIGIRNDLVDKADFKYPKPFTYKPTLKDALKDVPKSEGQQYSEKKRNVLDLVPPGGCWINLPKDIAKEFMGASYYSSGGKRGMARRISWDEACLTLTCSPAQKQTERCHPDETRPFTTREYARIQSFPDEWIFEGSMASVYKQIGNAVPVNLAKSVGLAIVDFLNKV